MIQRTFDLIDPGKDCASLRFLVVATGERMFTDGDIVLVFILGIIMAPVRIPVLQQINDYYKWNPPPAPLRDHVLACSSEPPLKVTSLIWHLRPAS
jgi:hypothetical protein